jgi:hypothetical protein
MASLELGAVHQMWTDRPNEYSALAVKHRGFEWRMGIDILCTTNASSLLPYSMFNAFLQAAYWALVFRPLRAPQPDVLI